jgi:hypothetical protein
MGADWAQLEEAAPEVAARALAVIERHRLLLAGTVRPDGTPRINPVEAHVLGGELSLALIPGSHKAADLRRDPRLTLQSPVADPDDPGEEVKIRGVAQTVTDEDTRRAIADAVEGASGWRPRPSWLLVCVDLEAVAHIEWIRGDMVLRRWSDAGGAEPTERRRLDMEAGAYVRSPSGTLGP